jgi:hypothetical protein
MSSPWHFLSYQVLIFDKTEENIGRKKIINEKLDGIE